MFDGKSLFEVAARVSTPLGLAGLVMATLFLILRQMVAKNIFPELTKAVGGALLKQIVDRLFVLALVAILLAAIGYMLPLVLSNPVAKTLPSAGAAQAVLTKLYEGKYQEVYDSLSSDMRKQIPYAVYLDDVKKEMSQFAGPPLYHHPRGTQTVAGFCRLEFDGEFDQHTSFREIVTYAETPGGWILYRFDLLPPDWPATAVAQLPDTTASSFFERIKGLPATEVSSYVNSQVQGHYIPLPGWIGKFDKVISKKDKRTCDVSLQVTSSKAKLILKDVLDGCSLKENQQVKVLGRVEGADTGKAEIASTRLAVEL